MQCTCAILSSVTCPALWYFVTYSHKWHDFRRKNYWPQTRKFCLKHFPFYVRRTERDMIKMYVGLHVNYRLFLLYFSKTWIFQRSFFCWKNTQISNFMKILPVIADSFHVCRRTDGLADMTKLIVAFRNFANAPKNGANKCTKCNETSLYTQ
jgi:hypothetical protein